MASKQLSSVTVFDDAASDVTIDSCTQDFDSFGGRFSPIQSDGRSTYSYSTSIDREFIVKDDHGRVVNKINEVSVHTTSMLQYHTDIIYFSSIYCQVRRSDGKYQTRHPGSDIVPSADVDEHTRLDIQHQMLKVKMGGLYWPIDLVRNILAPKLVGHDPPAVLDIGTGSGGWRLAVPVYSQEVIDSSLP